jgi:catechol 2,3-dioxygenase-like lactoylglutathione lyase family enzyme
VIDHIGISVSDFNKSKVFYTSSLASIGHSLLKEFPASVTGHLDVAGFGERSHAEFWLTSGPSNIQAIHVAFRVDTRAQVNAFYQAAIAAGGSCNGAPGRRPNYHQDYYGAFIHDPDGHNIEVVCHNPA